MSSPLQQTTLTAALMGGSDDAEDVSAGVLASNLSSTAPPLTPEGCLVLSFSTHGLSSEDLISQKTHHDFKMFVDVYAMPFFFLLAIPSNLINMVVFWKHGVKERINLCLFVLSFSDLVIVACPFVWKWDRLYSEITNSPYNIQVLKAIIHNKIHSLAAFVYISGFMSTLIAFERCLCVVSPLTAQRIIQTRTTAVIIFLGHAVIFAGHYINATRWEVVCMFDPLTGQTIDGLYSSDFYLRNQEFVDIFEGIVFGIVVPGFFVAGVSVSTVVIITKVHKMAQWREQSTSTSASGGSTAKDLNLTRMLIGTNVLFVACNAPPPIPRIAMLCVPELSLSGKYRNTYFMFINIQQLLAFINSSFNFFVYYFFGTKFRSTVQNMFCKGTLCRGSQTDKNDVESYTKTSSISVQ